MQLHFFLVMKTFKTYSLSNHQTCSTILISIVNDYSHCVVDYIARIYLPYLVLTNLFSVSMSSGLFIFFLSDFIHKWSHMVFVTV